MSTIFVLSVWMRQICRRFLLSEIDKIYLNFSDPWPKARHAKRRLTSKQFFERYDKILAFDGVVEFKTDNRELFDFSLSRWSWQAGYFWRRPMIFTMIRHSAEAMS